ncbi:copper amine oxidase N-terminal domain-containing protein [Paenibacillus sp. MZ04-78.2]|uniref:copper amine oxidase N-terminal domain-containing protein n=1 Tax=Paenibacillus sp. MZ04-78.2 TaxID=2962034 RepID=UPI0020B86168|nr:copper amine oxidase N-terminal domain-containing protein [Paenibacillus sp. MZ04-78.2]MCP3773506.1 copper amine oxidase N-terminal domain-containing protein [Paenibacillus sp. MZ04-78.2]
MRKYVIGFVCGLFVSMSTIVYASDSIQALLFPVNFSFNGNKIDLGEYKILNYENHTYVPIRFVAENTGISIRYSAHDNEIFLNDAPAQYIPLSTILKSDFDNITKIEVKFGDGGKVIPINEARTIGEISSKLKEIKLRKKNDQSPGFGYLYYLTIIAGDKELKYFNTLSLEDVSYESTQLTKELDNYILSLRSN